MDKSRFIDGNTRQWFILAQLLATLVLTGVLAYQAQDAARSHRMTAKSVLEDYSRLAGREFVASASNGLGYYGSIPIMKSFRNLEWPKLPPAVPLSEFKLYGIGDGAPDPETRISFCRFQLDSDEMVFNGDHSNGLMAKFLKALKTADQDPKWPFAFLFLPGENVLLVYRQVYLFPNRREGFLMDTDLLNLFFDNVLDRRQLMPVTGASEGIPNQALRISVFGPDGLLYHAGSGRPSFDATVPFEDGLGALRVRVAMDEKLASGLIIGGLPGSRLPLLLGLLLVAVGIVITTLKLLKRERQLSLRQVDSLAAVSHELRTPLAQIQMFVETLLLDRIRNPQEARRSLEIIFGETKRMNDLVENVVRFSSALQGLSKPKLVPVKVASLFAEQVAHFKPIIGERPTAFKMEVDQTIEVMAEPQFTRRMIRNLIDNALKYGPADGVITLGCENREKEVWVFVEDCGDGVPVESQGLIWQRFERLPKHRNSAVGGSGIGLWLVRELGKAQGVRSWVENGAGGGARFVLAYPPASAENGLHKEKDPHTPSAETGETTS